MLHVSCCTFVLHFLEPKWFSRRFVAYWGDQQLKSLSPKAGHNKAGRSDFRNQRFEPDTGKMRKMRTAPLTLQKQGSEETPQSQSAENAENAENADTKTLRESETAIKIKFALFGGGGVGRGQGGKLSKTLFFMGNVMTIKI